MPSKKSKGRKCPVHGFTRFPHPMINTILISETESKDIQALAQKPFVDPSVRSAGAFSPVAWLCLLPMLVLPRTGSAQGFGAVWLELGILESVPSG